MSRRQPTTTLFPYTTLFRSRAGVDTQVVDFEQPTRTSAEAAAAIGCSVAEIAKSIVFRRATGDGAVVVIASGDNRRSEEHTSELQSLRHLVCRLLLEKKNTS